MKSQKAYHCQAKELLQMGSLAPHVLFLISCSSLILAQQPYERKATTDCTRSDNSTGVLGYTCNGARRSCQAYLIFRSQPPYDTVSSISTLLASNPSQLSEINGVSERSKFDTNQEVIVPVNCSCSGEFYQANTSYVTQPNNVYLSVANNTFQGLSNCQTLMNQNIYPSTNLPTGRRIVVPLRCACPTQNQSDVGVRYLLSYIVVYGDEISSISQRFDADASETMEANELSEEDTIYPFTTLLIPLKNPPSRDQTVVPPPPPPAPPPPPITTPSNESSNKTWVYILAAVLGGAALVLAIGTIVYFKLFHKRNRKTEVSERFSSIEKPLNKSDEDPLEFLESISSIAQSLKVYSYGELQSATDNFNPKWHIKGSVVRGKINGDWAAIKTVAKDVSKEINLLNKINHFNLIRLSGISFHDGHWYLVYEYAANGSLSDWLHDNQNDNRFLDWTQRIQIALDVAAGLNYLHSYTNPPHVHKDLNSENVLLDSDFRAKVANFGVARSMNGEEGQFALTRHIVGTKGYMAPEYLEHGLVSPKLDVYAYGVLMLELLTGKGAATFSAEDKKVVLTDVLHGENGEEGLKDLIDPSLHGRYPSELAVFMVRLVDSCLNKDLAGRPSMDEIVQSLSGILTASMNCDFSQ